MCEGEEKVECWFGRRRSDGWVGVELVGKCAYWVGDEWVLDDWVCELFFCEFQTVSLLDP